MRITITKVKVKNFLSYGNTPSELEFQKGIDLLTAQNGSGKSSITLDALSYGLYGKPFRKIKLSSLQNQINSKNLEVIVEFLKEGSVYKVIRGMNPSKFEIYKDSELITQLANTKDYQEFLESKILQTSEKTFKNLIVLGSVGMNNSFLDLSQNDKEDIITNIIDIKVINLMLDKIKSILQTLKTQKTENTFIKENLEKFIKDTAEIIKRIKDSDLGRINQLKAEILELESYELEYKELSKSKMEIFDKLNKAKHALIVLESKIDSNKNNVFVCKKCGFENFLNKDEELESKHQKTLKKHNTLSLELDSINSKISNIQNHIDSLFQKRAELQSLESKIINSNENISILKETLKEKKSEYDNIKKELDSINTNIQKYNFINETLGKENIKKFIINQQIPLINELINEFLNMSLENYSFFLDGNLKDRILYKNFEQDYNQLSNGQKIRITFAIMFAFIKFLESKNSIEWNILILDEVLDSALDSDGVEILLNMLQKEFSNKNIIIITHKDDIKNLDIFSRRISITKDKFSSLKVENF